MLFKQYVSVPGASYSGKRLKTQRFKAWEVIRTFGNWSQVSLCVQAIVDTGRHIYKTDVSMQDDEELQWLDLEAKREEKEALFSVDKRALWDGLVEILWLVVYEQCPWENRMDVSGCNSGVACRTERACNIRMRTMKRSMCINTGQYYVSAEVQGVHVGR